MSAMFTVMMKELRDLSRDRRTVMIGLLFTPLLVTGLMVGIGGLVATKTKAKLEKTLDLPVVGAEHAPNLMAWLEGQNIDIEPAPANPEQAILDQDEDVILRIPAEYADDWRASRPAVVEVLHDATRQDSDIPVERVAGLLSAYSSTVGALRLTSRGIDPSIASPLQVARKDLSTPEAKMGQALAFLPYLLILSAFLGGAYLVIDTTAGERERQSLEPLLATPASRGAIMSGKIAAACVFGFVSLILTLGSFKVGFALMPRTGLKIDVSFEAIALLLLTLLPMLAFGSTLLTLIAASVKSVKEAQSYMSLLMMLPIIPPIYLMVSPVKNQLWMFAVPFLSQNQVIMSVVRGESISALEWAVYFGAGFGIAGVMWLLAARLYHKEKLAISA